MKTFIFPLIIYILPFISIAHPVHLSMTSIIINTKTQTFTVVSKLQEHDLLNILQIPEEQTQNNILKNKDIINKISAFFVKDFFIVQNNKKLNYQLKTIEKEDGFIKLTFTGKLKSRRKPVTIHNSLFIKYFKDQKNLAIISIDTKQQAFTFTNKIMEKLIKL